MSASSIKEPVVLALYFNTNGIGYALFEGIMDPVDWGMKTPGKTTETATMEQIRLLLELFAPSVVVLQKCRGPFMHCCKRVKVQIAKTAALARRKKILVRRYSRTDIRRCFAYYGARTKDEIARAIGERLPEFGSRVPSLRKLGEKEDYHMGVFDAAALATTYYWNEHLQSG